MGARRARLVLLALTAGWVANSWLWAQSGVSAAAPLPGRAPVPRTAIEALERGRPQQALELVQQALTLCDAEAGPEPPDRCLDLWLEAADLTLAMNGAVLGEVYARRALDLAQRTLGERHRDTATAYQRLAQANHLRRFTGGSVRSHRRALAVWQALGEEPLAAADSHAYVAGILEAYGRPEQAEVHRRRVLDLSLRLLGEGTEQTAAAHNSLGLNLRDQGRLPDAEPHFGRAMEIARRLYGDHRLTAIASNNVASTILAQGRAVEAEQKYRELLGLWQRIGGEPDDVASAHDNIGASLLIQGRAREAEAEFRQALAIEGQGGPETNGTAHGYSRVGTALLLQGRSEEAESYFRQALTIRLRIFGPDRAETAQSYTHIGRSLLARSRPAEAERWFRRALEIDRRRLRENHPDTGTSYADLGESLLEQGRPADAEVFFRRAADIFRRLLGERYLDTVRTYALVGRSLQLQSRTAEAEIWYRHALAGGDMHNPRGHPVVIRERLRLAGVWLEQSAHADEAYAQYDRALTAARDRIVTASRGDTAELREMAEYRPHFVRQLVAAWRAAHPATGEEVR